MLNTLIGWVEFTYNSLPLPLMEVWGRVAYIIGFLLAICVFGGFTFRTAGRWKLGRERQTWNGKAFASLALTFVLVPVSGYIGSNIVLVAGAQTLESLKDAMVFICIVLFGFPAVIAVTPAYMLSDLIEGIPPSDVWDYVLGYCCLPCWFWLGYQLIGRNPDFRRLRTWGGYGLYVIAFMAFYPPLWGYICGINFTSPISFAIITPALAFTMLITWVITPFLMLALFPLARKYGFYWAEIPGHVKQKLLGEKQWTWISGSTFVAQSPALNAAPELHGIPIRMLLAGTFIALVLLLVGGVAYLALRSGQQAAYQLTSRLHQEISENINMRLDDFMERSEDLGVEDRLEGMNRLLSSLTIAQQGRAIVIDPLGQIIASSKATENNDELTREAISQLRIKLGQFTGLLASTQYQFDVVTTTPLSKMTWLAQATRYADKNRRVDWIVITAMPESYYLASIQAGSSSTATFSAVALTGALLLAALLAGVIATPMRRISASAEAMAEGDLTQRVARSNLQELDAMVESFNRMAQQLQDSFSRTVSSEQAMKAIFNASPSAMVVFDMSKLTSEGLNPSEGLPIVDVNQAWERVTGSNRDALLGQPSNKLNLWSAEGDRQKFVNKMIREGRVDDFEAKLRRADGTFYSGLVSIRDAVLGNGRLAILAVEDVTELKESNAKLQELNRRLAVLFDAAVEVAIVATDTQGRVTVFNTGAEKMLGYLASEAIGQPILVFFRDDEIAACADSLRSQSRISVKGLDVFTALTRDGASNVRNWTYVRKDRTLLKVSLALNAVQDDQGSFAGFLGLARDITAQIAAESDLIALNQQLDLRVRRRTQELQASTEKLQSALDNLRQTQDKLVQSEKLASLGSIVAVVAHELNTPIGIGVTVASTMAGKTDSVHQLVSTGTLRRSQLDEYIGGQQEGMQLLMQALTRANELVANFKRVAVDQSSSQRRTFNLRQAIDDVAGLTKASLRKAPYKLEIDAPGELTMDSFPGAIEQVVINLFNNSIAHGFAGRDQGVMRLVAEPLDEIVTLTYSDDGNGMSNDVVRHIFDPFFTTAMGKGGSGLGMAICYNLVTGVLGGSIDVFSELGKGCRFIITMPRTAPDGPGATAAAMLKNRPVQTSEA